MRSSSDPGPARYLSQALASALCVLLSGAPAFAQSAAPPPPPPPPAAGDTAPPAAAEAPATDTGAAAPTEGKTLAESLTGAAKAEYEAGKILYGDGDYAGAELKFQGAYEKSKDYRLLWNMVACEKNMRHYAKAIEVLDRYLAEGGGSMSGEDRQTALNLRSVMAPFVGELTIEVNVPGAEVFVDDKKQGTSPLSQSLMLDMGVRRIRVIKDGYEEFVVEETIRGGKDATLSVALEKSATQGTLVIHAGTQDEIRIDGQVAATGSYTGSLEAGAHHVVVTAEGKIPYESDVVIQVGQRSTLQVRLENEAVKDKGGVPAWVWVVGGALVAGGAATGLYFGLRNNEPTTAEPVQGTIPPGSVQLPFLR